MCLLTEALSYRPASNSRSMDALTASASGGLRLVVINLGEFTPVVPSASHRDGSDQARGIELSVFNAMPALPS